MFSVYPVPDRHPAGGEAADLAAGEAAKTEEQATSSADGQVQMTEQEKEILGKLEKAFPGGTVAVQDVSGAYTSTHLSSDSHLPTAESLFRHTFRWVRDLLCNLDRERQLQGSQQDQAASKGEQDLAR